MSAVSPDAVDPHDVRWRAVGGTSAEQVVRGHRDRAGRSLASSREPQRRFDHAPLGGGDQHALSGSLGALRPLGGAGAARSRTARRRRRRAGGARARTAPSRARRRRRRAARSGFTVTAVRGRPSATVRGVRCRGVQLRAQRGGWILGCDDEVSTVAVDRRDRRSPGRPADRWKSTSRLACQGQAEQLH